MGTGDEVTGKKEGTIGSVDLEKLLEQREYLDELIQKKFTKVITIMFTDMKGSTSIAESEGDMISRILIKRHNDIVFPIIEGNRGVLVKTMGDGTLSYFETAMEAVRAAVQIQTGIDDFNNHSRKTGPPLQVRIGLNTGTGIVEKHDIFGDVVNVASRFESQAGPGEIFISEKTYNSLTDKEEFYCKFMKTTTLKNKSGTFKIFKVFWNKDEIEKDKAIGEYACGRTEAPELTVPVKESGSRQGGSADGETDALQKARNLEKDSELVKLFMHCEGSGNETSLNATHQKLKNELEKYNKINTKFGGEEAVWFYKKTITVGRIAGADFPMTNQALSRVPIRIGIKNGEGFLEIDSGSGGKTQQAEIEKDGSKETVRPSVEYPLGKKGKIVFSVCFPLEYSVYEDRFLTLKVLNPEDCIRRQFNFGLDAVWKDFRLESGKIVIIGV